MIENVTFPTVASGNSECEVSNFISFYPFYEPIEWILFVLNFYNDLKRSCVENYFKFKEFSDQTSREKNV